MKKYILIIIIIIILLLLGLIIYLNFFTDKITVETPAGQVKINDIYKNPAEVLPQNDIVFKNSEYYSMYYYPKDQSFTITILNKDLSTARQMAENDFLNTLKINKQDACKLKVILSVPYEIDPNATGKNYGLSFCPDSLSF